MNKKGFGGAITFEWFSVLRDLVVNFWAIVLAAVTGFSLIYVYEQATYKPVYTSSATIMVQVKTGTYQAYTNLSASSEMALILSEIFVQPSMKEKAAEYLGEETFEGKIASNTLTNTNIITLSVTDDDPEKAYREIKAILEVYPEISDTIFSNAVLDVVSAPEIPKGPANTAEVPYKKVLALCFAVVAAGVVVLLSIMRDTVKDENSFTSKIGVKLISTVMREHKYRSFGDFIKKKKKKQLITDVFCSRQFIESCQKIATQLEYHKRTRGDRIFLITSVAANEGKTTISVNTALSLASRGYKVALLDMDFMKPSIIKTLEVEYDRPDLAEMLVRGDTGIEMGLQQYKSTSMWVGLNKRRYVKFADWINLPATKTKLYDMVSDYDFVIIDSMPITASADLMAIAELSDKTALIIRADYVKTGDINDAVLVLNKKNKLAGCIFNDAHKEFSLFGQMGGNEQARAK